MKRKVELPPQRKALIFWGLLLKEIILQNTNLIGWTEYYRHTACSRKFRKVQGHTNRRLRKFIMKKKHSRKAGYKELPDEKLYNIYELVNVGANRVQYRWT